jgi:membrane protease YdiL (CAAX protease family)
MQDSSAATGATKPRLWTLALAGVSALLASLLAAGIALAVVAWNTLGSPPNAAAITAIAKRPLGLSLAALCQSLVFAATALIAAALSAEGLKKRLALSLGQPRGLRWLGLAAVSTLAGLSGSAAVFNLALAIAGGVPSKSLEAIDRAIRGASGGEFVLLVLAVAVCAPLGEELFFRGYLQSRLVARFGAAGGVLLSALWFALAHFDPMHSSATFAMGLALGYAVLRSGSLWVSVLAHLINNSIAVLTARLGPATEQAASAPAEHVGWALAFALVAALAVRGIATLTEPTRG